MEAETVMLEADETLWVSLHLLTGEDRFDASVALFAGRARVLSFAERAWNGIRRPCSCSQVRGGYRGWRGGPQARRRFLAGPSRHGKQSASRSVSLTVQRI